ncbi:hypothetical protein PF002_g6195 [Phytophthora fragariae]|uniref:Uncharacterized protein n=1 Tax=Phytophthora fragariae TaxID=53985 RepID=A0A6A3ZYU6_9STRA|nr:hypothetical protein PF003_g36256 [Phytophthora fragariae]KAE8944880.1 hypothetical protein PF009_g5451 [Phytophthora fragariae]KAE9023121.1 hypothetical protein PF011_g4141 [Phytophthora fragariae]KAE9151777.1 hypothetical protein PF006_g3953 [Phytophthora fragariae]KAE9247592.1 hypothetical protein PF002_g6195 [Phytophthora fragariae]
MQHLDVVPAEANSEVAARAEQHASDCAVPPESLLLDGEAVRGPQSADVAEPDAGGDATRASGMSRTFLAFSSPIESMFVVVTTGPATIAPRPSRCAQQCLEPNREEQRYLIIPLREGQEPESC